jgi:hypothetical protein
MLRWWPLGTVLQFLHLRRRPGTLLGNALVQLARSVMDAHYGRIGREQPDHVIERAIVGNPQRVDQAILAFHLA